MIRKRMKDLCLILVCAILICAGCGLDGNRTEEEAQWRDDKKYNLEHVNVSVEASFTEVHCMAVADGIWVFGENTSEGKRETAVYYMEMDKDARQITNWQGEELLVWNAGEEGKAAFVTFTEEGNYVLHILTKDGEESSCPLNDALKSIGQFGFFLSIAVSENSIALADTQAGMVFVIGYPEGTLLQQIPMEDYINSMHFVQDGVLKGITQNGTLYDMNPVSGSRESVAERLFESISFPKDCFWEGEKLWISSDAGVFFLTDDMQIEQVIDYMDYDIVAADAMDIYVDEDREQWKLVTWNDAGGEIDLYSLSQGKPENTTVNAVEEKEVITLSHYMVNTHLQEAVAAFNQSSDKYRVEVVTAGEGDDWNQYMDERAMQILAGKGPDIFMATSDSRFSEYMEKGVLEDLQPYIDADLQEEAYLENGLYAYKRDGKVYALEEGFGIKLLFSKEALLGDGEGWTFAELQAIVEENPQIKAYIEYFSKQDVLESCLAESGISPADYAAIRECILFAESYGQGLPMGEKAVLGENVLVMEMGLTQPWDIMDYLVTFGEDIVFVGYPRQDGQGILHDSGGWSINASSENKEGAWAFLQFLLEEEYQMKLAKEDSGYFPVLKTAFEAKMELAETPLMQEVFVPEENKYEMQEMARYAVDGVPIYTLPKEWTDLIRKLAEESRVFCFENDYGAWVIVSEEAEYFFSQEKSIDEVMEIIENRMNLYLSEKE